MTRHRLTPELQDRICRFILSGGYPQVAAEAAGLPREVFTRWLARGQARKAARKYRLFWEAIREARAQVRLAAEARVLSRDALGWLKCGPGKDSPDGAGWSNPVRGQTTGDESETSLLLHQEVRNLVTAMLDVLAPFPEARTALAAALCPGEEERTLTSTADSRHAGAS